MKRCGPLALISCIDCGHGSAGGKRCSDCADAYLMAHGTDFEKATLAEINAALPDAIIIDNLLVWTGARKVSM